MPKGIEEVCWCGEHAELGICQGCFQVVEDCECGKKDVRDIRELITNNK